MCCYPEIYQERKIKNARKQHKCYECNGKIMPGEPYVAVSGLWEGDFSHFHFCPECRQIHRDCKHDDDLPFGDLFDHLVEYEGNPALVWRFWVNAQNRDADWSHWDSEHLRNLLEEGRAICHGERKPRPATR